ncbi:MAG: IclR family transcriptional regulator, partial [Anaerolineae bacterium]|nr:IclR family transcriptional regulator [Anaerolineae bacterium]
PAPNYQIRALDRALTVLESFAGRHAEQDLSAICERAQLPKSTAYKILSVLEHRGYVQRNEATGNYRIGFQAYEVGNLYLAGLSVFEVVHPVLKRLAARFPKSSAHLAVLSPTNGQIVYLDIVSLNIFLSLVPVGSHYPAHSTALGKCLLAGLPEGELNERLAGVKLEPHTPRTIVDLGALRAHLAQVRAQGYAIDDEEMAAGYLCIAVPVLDRRGRTIAAISTSHSKETMVDGFETALEEMRRAGAEIDRALGYVAAEANEWGAIG